jgi:hypothetical protein
MAITIKAAPTELTPAYNPVMIYADSTNKSELGFRYVVDVYDDATSTKLFEQRVAPRPVDGYMELNLSKAVSDYVDNTPPFNNTSSTLATGSFRELRIEIGEEYVVSWDFTDYGFNNDYSGGNTGLFQSPNVTPHPFAVGDQVRVKTNATYTDNRQSLNGLFTVIGVEDAYDFVISLSDVGSFPATAGKVSFADNRRTIFRDLADETFTVFNGALALKPFKNWTPNDYLAQVLVFGKFLTNAPRPFKVKVDSEVWLNLYGNSAGNMREMYVRNDDGDMYNAVLTDAGQEIKQLAIGLGNFPTLTPVGGAVLPVIKDNTKTVDVWVANVSGVRMSEIFTYEIDRRCTIEDYEILFMDRLGSFVPFAFQLRSMERGSIMRETFNKKFGDIVGDDTYSFNLYDQGYTTYHVDTEKTLELNTNYMDDEHSVYFEELLTSPYTYLRVGDDYYSVTVQETSFETMRQKNKRLIRKTVNVKFNVNTPVNI